MSGLIKVIERYDLEAGLTNHPGRWVSKNELNNDVGTYSFASASFVPLSRTMSGTVRDNSFAALMTPSAM